MKKIQSMVLFFMFCALLAGKDLPYNIEKISDKIDDTMSMGMGYSGVSMTHRGAFDTNPAGLSKLTTNYLGFNYTLSESELYTYYEDSDQEVLELSRIKGFYLASSKGGFYFKSLLPGEDRLVSATNKYNLKIYESGISVSNRVVDENNKYSGLITGLTLKTYIGEIMEIDGSNMEIDRAIGVGFDYGMIYEKSNIALGLAFKDIYSRIFWNDYKKTKIPGKIDMGISFDLAPVKVAFAANRLMKDDVAIQYSYGIEMKVMDFPEEYTSWWIKGLEAKLRYGAYGTNLFSDNKKYTTGIDLENTSTFLSIAVVSNKISPFEDSEKNIYKMELGMKLASKK